MNFCSDCPHDGRCLDSCLKLRLRVVDIDGEQAANATLQRTVNDQAGRIISLAESLSKLEAELRVTDDLLADRQRVLDAIPCCVPHALQWIADAQARLSRASRSIDERQRVDGVKVILDFDRPANRMTVQHQNGIVTITNIDIGGSAEPEPTGNGGVRATTAGSTGHTANTYSTAVDVWPPRGFARCGVCRTDYPLGTRHDCKATEPTT